MKQKGFTLIEIIVSLVLMGIVGLFIGQAIYQVVQSYIFAKSNIEMTEKTQLALTRMTLELQYANSIQSATEKEIKYTTTKDSSVGEIIHSLQISSDKILLDNHILIDQITRSTNFTYQNQNSEPWHTGENTNKLALIDITIGLKHPSVKDVLFKTSINIRNNNVANTAAPISNNP